MDNTEYLNQLSEAVFQGEGLTGWTAIWDEEYGVDVEKQMVLMHPHWRDQKWDYLKEVFLHQVAEINSKSATEEYFRNYGDLLIRYSAVANQD